MSSHAPFLLACLVPCAAGCGFAVEMVDPDGVGWCLWDTDRSPCAPDADGWVQIPDSLEDCD